MISDTELGEMTGRDVYGSDGEKIGTAGQVWVDDVSGRPEWITVKTGLFGMKESFVPLADAEASGDGIRVPYTKDQVKDAASIDADNDHLDASAEEQLYQHYGISYGADDTGSAGGTFGQADRGDAAYAGTSQYSSTGDDVQTDRGRTGDGDDAMTLSEERLNVGTQREQVGKARLRKYVVTDQEQVTVPVTREEVRLEREPVTEGNVGDATSGPEITESEHEVTLHAERPVVQTEAVPVERVRLNKETVTDTETVQGEVRKEQIDLDADGVDVRDADRTRRS